MWLCLFSLFAAPVFGQHRGGVGTGLGRRGFASGALAPGRSRGVVVVGGFGFPSQGFINLGIPPGLWKRAFDDTPGMIRFRGW